MNIKVFTHIDLDGIGSGLLLHSLYPNANVDITEMNYHEIPEVMRKFHDSKSYEKYDFIYMTDLSIPEANLDIVEELDKLYGHKFQLLDHHASAKWQNKYKWSEVIDEKNGKKTSGTSLVMDYARSKGLVKNVEPSLLKRMFEFADLVRSYDTWEWTQTGHTEANEWNTIFFKTPRTEFKNRMLNTNYDLTFTEEDREIIIKDTEELNDAIKSVMKQLVEVPVTYNNDEYRFGVAVEERKVSEVGNKVSELRPDLFGIVLLNKKLEKASFRTVNNVRMDSLVKDLFGGGGHPKACGAMLTNENGKDFIQRYQALKKGSQSNMSSATRMNYVFNNVRKMDNYELKMKRLNAFTQASEFYKKEVKQFKVTDNGLIFVTKAQPELQLGLTFNGLYRINPYSSNKVEILYTRASEDRHEVYCQKLLQIFNNQGIFKPEYAKHLIYPFLQAFYLQNKLPEKP